MQTSQFTCNKCVDDRNGVAYCGICNVHLCYPCVEDHARISKTMGHVLLDAMHSLPFYPQELTKSKEKNRHIQTSIKHLAEKCRGQTDGEFQAGDLDFEQEVGVIAAAIEDRERFHNELTKAKAEVLQMQTNIKHLASKCYQPDKGEAGDMEQYVGEITDGIEERKRLHQEITKLTEEIHQMLVSIKLMADERKEPTNDKEACASGFKRDVGVITATFDVVNRCAEGYTMEKRLERNKMKQKERIIIRLKRMLTKTKVENLHMKVSVQCLANEFREQPDVQGTSRFDFKGDMQLIADNLNQMESLIDTAAEQAQCHVSYIGGSKQKEEAGGKVRKEDTKLGEELGGQKGENEEAEEQEQGETRTEEGRKEDIKIGEELGGGEKEEAEEQEQE